MKKIILLVLCMFVLGSGSAMAASWPLGGQSLVINENTDFNAIALFNFSGQSVFDNPALNGNFGYSVPITLPDGSIFWGWNGSWHVVTGDDGTTASGDPVTSLNFYVDFAGIPHSLQFYVGVYEDTNLLNYVEFEYFLHYYPDGSPEWQQTVVPEPSLVLLLGIGLGAVGLIVWRRVV